MSKINFGTGGFRAVIGEDFTKENVQLVCQAISNIILKEGKKREICIGYDNRFMSEIYAIWCAEVFAGNGVEVELFDEATSTPVAMYASKLNGNDFGIMITASHNPYIYNGIKVFIEEGRDAGVDITNLIEREIDLVKEVKTIDYKEGLTKNIRLANYVESYVANIVNALDLKSVSSNLNVVFEAKHGSTVNATHLFAKKIGLLNYKIINSNRDAFFSFKTPAPTVDNLQELKDAVNESNANIGFALDADGDRLAVIDEKGNYIDNNYILAISYYFLVKYCGKHGGSVKNIATSNLLDKVTENLGYQCVEVPVGFKYVSSAIIENNAVVGGESSGGLAINGHIWGKDSLLAIAICLKAMSIMGKSFSEILQEVLDFAGGYTKVILDRQYTFTMQQKEFIDDVLFKQHKLPCHRFEVEKVVCENYIKVYYKNGNWSLIRFSGTEPIIRIFAEGDTLQEATDMIDDFEKFLHLEK
ncbi:MAG: phosphoglucomutase/phosphomannomutase family protein [Clostridia bacterium]|nr:phosphoglucomutase/phosphomannomutase family protein [Clostridia bacterium]